MSHTCARLSFKEKPDMTHAIRRAAVIGSGVMGGAIAAHLANVGVPVDLLDIAPRELTLDEEKKGLALQDRAVRNRIVTKGWDAVVKSRPAALVSHEKAGLVRLGNLEDDFERLCEADWIIEVVVERLDVKQALMARIESVRKPDTIVSSNTSGIPINDIADGLSLEFRQHFLGTHFFNPPRYLKLLEIIPHRDTLPEVIEMMIKVGEELLGKGVVVSKDTPNFIANRFFSLAGAYEIAYALDNGYTIEEVDSLAGPLVGRPKSAIFRLLDLVGLDVMAHVNNNLYDAIPDDESRDILNHEGINRMMTGMMRNGWLGNKSGQGFYKAVVQNGQKEFWSLNPTTLDYVAPGKPRFDSVGKYRKVEPTGARVKALIGETDRAAEFVRNATYYRLSYAARRIPEIADDLVSIDRAVRWGFAEEMGPFEMWDSLGVAETAEAMQAAGYEVPTWVDEMVSSGYPTFYQYENDLPVGYYDINMKSYTRFVEKSSEIKVSVLQAQGKEIESNEDATIFDLGDGIGLLAWFSKANTITPKLREMAWRAIEMLNDGRLKGLVIGHDGELFCGGVNLDMASMQQEAIQRGLTPAELMQEIANDTQQMMIGFRYAQGPVVVAAFDRALGGGVELIMAADRVVAHNELYAGLVEVGVGLIPGWGGCKELLRRVVNPTMRIPNGDPLPPLAKVFEQIGLAKFSTSAAEAREMGFLAPCDRIIANRDHLIAEAKREALHMVASGYRPLMPEKIYAAGRDLLAALRAQIFMLRDGGYASEYDAYIANKLGYILCGGDLSEPTWVDEQYILDLERAAALELIQNPKTIERIFHMLSTGKPLRN
jgi:3-hydroxyacyl-CoA dehydrogenase